MRFVFWQQIPSLHQRAHLEALAGWPGVHVTLLADQIPLWRQQLGWHEPKFEKVELVSYANSMAVTNWLADTGGDTLHVVSGIRDGYIRQALAKLCDTKARIALMAERGDIKPGAEFARRLVERLRSRGLRNRFEFVLAISSLAVDWYRRCGYRPCRLFPYGYFVDRTINDIAPPNSGPFKIIYVGRLRRQKGVDVLISALSQLRAYAWTLTVVGSGPDIHDLLRLAARSKITHNINVLGPLPNEVARAEIARSDLLVLPSRWDGWGVVVNEALIAGVPVICTSSCGAADLLRHGAERGVIVRPNSVSQLREAIESRLEQGRASIDARRSICRWSERISGRAAAGYLIEIAASRGLSHVVPPWLADPVGDVVAKY